MIELHSPINDSIRTGKLNYFFVAGEDVYA